MAHFPFCHGEREMNEPATDPARLGEVTTKRQADIVSGFKHGTLLYQGCQFGDLGAKLYKFGDF